METKICKKCNLEKKLCEFGVLIKSTDGLRNTCKLCRSVDEKKYRENNKEKVYDIKRNWVKNNQAHIKEYYEKNKERLKQKSRNVYEKNKLRYNQQSLLWNKINSEKRKKITKKHKEKPEVKLKESVRHRIYIFLKRKNLKKNDKTIEIVGCSPSELKKYLEKQFINGMTWENHSLYGWHIDHIIPLSSAKTEEEIYKLCHYTNLQPLWATDNLKKLNKIL
jgi:hypothetical protein